MPNQVDNPKKYAYMKSKSYKALNDMVNIGANYGRGEVFDAALMQKNGRWIYPKIQQG